jgi:hypothetical protein
LLPVRHFRGFFGEPGEVSPSECLTVPLRFKPDVLIIDQLSGPANFSRHLQGQLPPVPDMLIEHQPIGPVGGNENEAIGKRDTEPGNIFR